LRRDYIRSGSGAAAAVATAVAANLNGNNGEHDDNGNSDTNSTHSSGGEGSSGKCRKPSYVGLSCAISGYSSYVRYQSPSRKTSPSQIPVQTGPQTLDAVFNTFSHTEMRHTHDMPAQTRRVTPPSRGQQFNNNNNNGLAVDCTDDSVSTRNSRSTVFASARKAAAANSIMESNIIYSSQKASPGGGQGGGPGGGPGADTLREGSPGSDCSGSSSIGSAGSGSGTSGHGGGGNLVAKQIERLYGGRVQAIRVTSPEPKASETSFDNNNKKGYFVKRFNSGHVNGGGGGGNPDADRSSSPLEKKSPLKGPAVFRLLRPEFREQLKNNSCQVHIPSENQSHIGHHKSQTTTTTVTTQITTAVKSSPFGYRVTTSRQNRENGARTVPISHEEPLKSATMVTKVTSKDMAVKERVIPIQVEQQSHSRNLVATSTPPPPAQPEVSSVTVSVTATKRDDEEPKTVNIPIERTPSLPVVKSHSSPHNVNNNHHTINTNITSRSPAKVDQQKPALPAKPLPAKPAEDSDASPVTSPDENKEHVVTSPGLVANCFNNKIQQEEEEVEEVEEDDDYYASRRLRDESSPGSCGGTRERALLCPIQEEDTESTASTASFSRQTSRTGADGGGNQDGIPADAGVKPAAVSSPSPTSPDPSQSNGIHRSERESSTEEVHDGHYFIRVMEEEIFKFEEQICDYEEELAASDNCDDESKKIPDEVRDSILAANGKAKLLISQKLAQFRGLCDKNINLSFEEDPFVPTSEDLAGFWDMVYIQVEHINALFAELATLRKNGWVSKKPLNTSSSMLTAMNGRHSSPTKPSSTPKATTPKSVSKKSPAAAKSSTKSPAATPDSGKKSEAAKARDEARKKMMEERRRMMREKKKELEANSSGEVEVFVK